MQITEEIILHIANLARLNLTPDEKSSLAKDLKSVLQYVEKLDSLDTEGVEPTAHVMDINNILRDDVVFPSFDREQILSNAPSKLNGCINVPKVVE